MGSSHVWYRVRDFDAGRAFYTGVLGLEEIDVDRDGCWARRRERRRGDRTG